MCFAAPADLFSFIHGPSASRSSAGASSTSAPEAVSLSEESAALLSQQLVAAHDAYRQGNHEASYDAYQQLAEHFASDNQLPNARFFYDRCLQVSTEHTWADGRAAAHANLGEHHNPHLKCAASVSGPS